MLPMDKTTASTLNRQTAGRSLPQKAPPVPQRSEGGIGDETLVVARKRSIQTSTAQSTLEKKFDFSGLSANLLSPSHPCETGLLHVMNNAF